MSQAELLEKVSKKRFAELIKPIIGMPVSYIWRGHGSAIFLEFGQLQKSAERKHFEGESTLMIQWSWRIEKLRSIDFGSFSSAIRIDNKIKSLIGKVIQSIELEGRLPEITIKLSGNIWVHSFSTVEGQPEWALFLPDGSWLCVERGIIIRETDE